MIELLKWEKIDTANGICRQYYYRSKIAIDNFVGELNTNAKYEIDTVPGFPEYTLFLLNNTGDFLEIGHYLDFESASETANKHYLEIFEVGLYNTLI